MTTDEFDSALGDLETRVDRLRALYENWFRGYEKSEPSVARKEVERRVYALRKELPRNTALRFRYHQLYLRYTSLATYWQRTARQIEDGTHKLQLQRLRRRNQRGEGGRTEEREERREEGGPRQYELDLDESLNVDDLLDDLEIDEVARALDAPGPHSPPPPAPLPAARPTVSRNFARQRREESLPSLPPVALEEELPRPRPAAAQQRSPAAGASQFPDFEQPTAVRNQPLDLRAPAVPRRDPIPPAARAAPQGAGSDGRRELPLPPGVVGTPAAAAPGWANAVPSLGNKPVSTGKGPLPAPPRAEAPALGAGPLPGAPGAAGRPGTGGASTAGGPAGGVLGRPAPPAGTGTGEPAAGRGALPAAQAGRPAPVSPGVAAGSRPGAPAGNAPGVGAATGPAGRAVPTSPQASGRAAPPAPGPTGAPRPAPPAQSPVGAGAAPRAHPGAPVHAAPAAPGATGAGRPSPASPSPTAAGRPAPAAPGATGAGRPSPASPSPTAAGRPAPAAPAATGPGRPAPAGPGATSAGARQVPIVNADTIVGRPPVSSPISPSVSSAPNEQRMRRIYDEYAAARRRNNEGEVRYEAMVSSIQKMLPEIAKRHQGRPIDFEVVVKDGRVGLKPKAT
jgi:hypothetical protein